MKQQYKLNVTPRAQTGRSSSRRLRKANQVPAILYGKHTPPETLVIDGPEFTRLIKSVAGSAALIDYVRSHAPGFIFTTSLPPALAAGALAAIRHLKTSQAERDRHQERVARVKERLLAAGLPVMPSQSHIVPVLIGDAKRCKAMSDALLERHRKVQSEMLNRVTVDFGGASQFGMSVEELQADQRSRPDYSKYSAEDRDDERRSRCRSPPR